jgi:hypothetical protein
MKIEQLIKAVNESQTNEVFADLVKKEKEIAAANAVKPAGQVLNFPKTTAGDTLGQTTPAQRLAQQKAASQPGALKKAWDYANSQQSGADVQKFGQGVADAGGSLSRGAQTVAKGTGNLVKGVGQGVASALGGVGDVAGAATNAIGRFAGGFKSGYNQQTGRGGSSYSAPASSSPSASTNAQQPDQSDEIAQLRSQLQAMQQKMTRAGIQENQKKGN